VEISGEIMQDSKYCVYLHRRKDTNDIFYVGQGTLKRPYVTTRKLKAWNDLVKQAGGFIVEIIEDSLSKEAAIALESIKIEEYKKSVVNLQTSSSKTKELDYDTFNQKFYIDETSPSGLRFRVNVYAGKNYNSLVNSKDSVAGILSPDGSWSITHKNKSVKVHRVIYLLANKSIDSSKIIDHINGNPSDNSLKNLRQVCSKVNRRNLKIDKRNSTGVTGVSSTIKNTYRASVLDESGVRLEKSFSISKYGKEEAFRLACEWRKEQIEQLNANGAGYTERHGT
jgi:hypothetical protein